MSNPSPSVSDRPLPSVAELDGWYGGEHYAYLDSAQAMSLYKTVANAALRFGCRRILDVGRYHAHPLLSATPAWPIPASTSAPLPCNAIACSTRIGPKPSFYTGIGMIFRVKIKIKFFV